MVELLSPAGDFNCLKAAIDNGANAVYLGGKNFSARAFATNFDNDELIRAIKYAHLRNVKIYVTVNTLLSDSELENALKQIEFYYHNNVDALIIQDLGLYYVIKQKYPDFDLHCSTQMHIHNIDGIKVAKELGFKKVVVARESNLEFIKEACKQGIDIETFVHGAICVSYSGQCLMSSATKTRSANKGMCAQCCRLKYNLYSKDKQSINSDSAYLLSPKDMMLIENIGDLISAGVSSFKIEGRLKSAAYVGYITSLYRKAIDAYYEKRKFVLTSSILKNVKVLFNRDFTNDYLFNKAELFGQNTPNHLGIKIGEVIKNFNKQTYIKLSYPVNQFDGIRIGDYGCILNRIYKNGLLVNNAKENDIISIDTDYKIEGIVYKTLDYKLEKEILNTDSLRIPLNIVVEMNQDLKVIVKAPDYGFSYKSNLIANTAINRPLTYEDVFKQFSKLNETGYYLNSLSLKNNNAFLPVSKLNEIRRQFINELNDYRLNSFKRITIDTNVCYKDLLSDNNNEFLIEENNNINGVPINYVINTDSKYIEGNKGVISEFGGLLKNYKEKIAYYTLNCFNSYTYELLLKLGFTKIILSSEVNNYQVNEIINNFKQRNGIDIHPYVFKKGKRALMYIKSNPFNHYIDKKKGLYISDGVNNYSIHFNEDSLEIVQDNYSNEINNEHTLTFIKK